MLLEGVNFDEFAEQDRGTTPSPKTKKNTVVQKRKRKEKVEEEEEEEKETAKKRIRRGGARWHRGGRHVENVSVTTTMQFGTLHTVIFTIIFNADFKQEDNDH